MDVQGETEGWLKWFNLNAEFISEILLHYCSNLNVLVACGVGKYLAVIVDNLGLSQKIRAQEVFAEHAMEPPLQN